MKILKMICYENVLTWVHNFKQDKTKTCEYINYDRGNCLQQALQYVKNNDETGRFDLIIYNNY